MGDRDDIGVSGGLYSKWMQGSMILYPGGCPGNEFFVDSNVGSDADGYGYSWSAPTATIDYAVALCAANNGDVIWVAPGHVETVIAAGGLDLDVEGITIRFLGNGDDQAYVTFTTDVGADIDIDAANITLVNPRFVSGIDALTGPIDVNKAYFKIINGTWVDVGAYQTTDAVVADANADYMFIDGWKYIGGTGGTQPQSNIQFAAATGVRLKNIDIQGDFGTGNIENGAAATELLLERVIVNNLNATPKPGLVFHANTQGLGVGCFVGIASGTTPVTASTKMRWLDSYYANADGGAADEIGMAMSTGLEGKIDIITSELAGADGIASFPAAAAAANNVSIAEVIRYIQESQIGSLTNSGGGTATLGGILGDVANSSIATRLTAIDTQVDKIDGLAVSGTPTANSLAAFIATGGTALGTSLPASKSLYDEVIQWGRGTQLKKTVTYSGGAGPLACATVTGVIGCIVFGHVTTGVTDHGDSTSLGTAAVPAGLLAATTGTALKTAETIWTDTGPSDVESLPGYKIVSHSDVIVTTTVNLAGGVIDFYFYWWPISSDGALA